MTPFLQKQCAAAQQRVKCDWLVIPGSIFTNIFSLDFRLKTLNMTISDVIEMDHLKQDCWS